MLTPQARALLPVYSGSGLQRVAGVPARVAVVGAGLAGLCCAHILARAGCTPEVFEASGRVGGRVRTEAGGLHDGMPIEHGGEFIDTAHADMLALAAWLELPLIDTAAPGEGALATAYHFAGQSYSEAQVLQAYRAIAPRIAADAATLSPRVCRRSHTPADVAFDRTPLSDYLAQLDCEPWLRALLEVAYVTEYGGDADRQSSINLLSLIGTDTTDGFAIFGDSDERYKLRDGAERIPQALARGLGEHVHLQHRLLRVAAAGAAYTLTLQTDAGTRESTFDAVVLALPFTLLRQVEFGFALPPAKRLAIDSLGYGSNAKLMAGLDSRLWRAQGQEGGLYTDLAMQTGWDASRLRDGTQGVFTWFQGGNAGLALGQGTPEAHVNRFASMTDSVFTGFSSRLNGSVARAHWPSEPFALGSYTCYVPGQWTTLAGEEAESVDGLYFAGEHCASDSQGYMNGAAETGRQAAVAILSRLGSAHR